MKSLGRIAATTAPVIVALVVQALPALAAAGALDPHFSGDGKVITRVGPSFSTGHAVAVQTDGRIVVAGSAQVSASGGFAFAVVRYNPHGSLDDTFSDDGRVMTRIGSTSFGRAVAVEPDGKIVVAGFAAVNGRERFAVARYKPNGRLDRTFSGDGILTTPFMPFGRARGFDLAIQPDGRIVVAGDAGRRFALARYKPSGLLDPSFGGDGKVTTRFRAPSGSAVGARGVALEPDGRIVAAGTAYGFAVARYKPHGTLDATFSGDGKVITQFLGSGDGSDVAIQSDGKIVVGGTSRGPGGLRFALARYKPHGTLDTTFGGDGRVVTSFGHGFDAELNAVALPRDGRIVAAGFRQSVSCLGCARFALSRYNPAHGGLDRSFGGDGRVVTRMTHNAAVDDLAVQADRKIVAAGNAYVNHRDRFALARYLGA